MDLKVRVLEGELMDAPDLPPGRHVQALKGLERVNLFSGTAGVIARAIVQHFENPQRVPQPCKDKPLQRPVRILDLACGGGDVTLAVGQRLLAAGLEVDIQGWDRSQTAVDYANQRSRAMMAGGRAEASNRIRFLQQDVHELAAERQFDVVMCTLFLHHLSRDEAFECLKKMYRAANEMVLVDDLRRTWLGYRLAQLGCQLLSRSPIVHVDGPLSVRAAFTESELKKLSREAELPEPRFVRHWPQRFLMRWDRSA